MVGKRGTNMAVDDEARERRGRRNRGPLDAGQLQELALYYAGRYATSRARLASYLRRKLRERGWTGPAEPPVDDLVARLEAQGYVDDRGYALMKSRALSARGYGPARVRQTLRVAGIDSEAGAAALDTAEREQVDSALRFARRRRIGPFATEPSDRAGRDKAIAAMARAGHPLALAVAIAALEPGSEPDLAELSQKAQRS